MTRTTIPADELVHKAHTIGQYYGFIPLTKLTSRARSRDKRRNERVDPATTMRLDPAAEMVASFLRQCSGTAAAPTARQPLFVWHTNVAAGRPAPKRAVVQFHAIGSDRALADAVVIRTLLSLVRDLFRSEPVLRINSMGDRETRARYVRELATYFKKHATSLPEECIVQAKSDVLHAAEIVVARECADDLPAPTEFLSDASRRKFEDLLEYLEQTDTPYELARDLISRGDAWNDVCFEFVLDGQRVAWGSRYGELARRFYPGAVTAAIGAILTLSSEGKVVKKLPNARLRFSFIHIGDEAKRLSIRLAEDFRRARLPLTQHIGIESLMEQLHVVERTDSPYLLIMGRQEALENSAILRNRRTQEETLLPLDGLIDYLKAVV